MIPPEMRQRMVEETIPAPSHIDAGGSRVADPVPRLRRGAPYITGATYDINGGVVMR